VDEVANIAVHLGPGALIAKMDIESAYRLIPEHQQDRPLLALMGIEVDLVAGQLRQTSSLGCYWHSSTGKIDGIAHVRSWNR